MLTRRQLLEGASLALATGAVLGRVLPLCRASNVAALQFHAVLFDVRYEAARTFGRTLAQLRIAGTGFDGDLSALWFDDLYPQWRARPVAIAGLTHHRALICLESFAHAHGLRVLYRGEHRTAPDGMTHHRLQGPASLPSLATGLEQTGHWPTDLAGWIATFAPGRGPLDSLEAHSLSARTPVGTLFSWVIAPPPTESA